MGEGERRPSRGEPPLNGQPRGPTRRQDELVIFSMSSVFATKGNVFDCKFINMVLPHDAFPTRELQDGVHREFCRFIAWSLAYCEAGRYPTHGYRGEDFKAGHYRASLAGNIIAGPWKAVYGCWKGDRKARRETHAFAQHHNAMHICELCRCCVLSVNAPAHLNYCDFSPGAPWRATERTMAEYLVQEAGRVLKHAYAWARVKVRRCLGSFDRSRCLPPCLFPPPAFPHSLLPPSLPLSLARPGSARGSQYAAGTSCPTWKT
jgi:hypothetical protein